jgi:hypothetical protein|tara:strand:- start:2507 stop:3616 length:1110 start_codon:yes stop_codon:yes gene_type:complete
MPIDKDVQGGYGSVGNRPNAPSRGPNTGDGGKGLKNKKGTSYSDSLSKAIDKVNKQTAQNKLDRQLARSLNQLQLNAIKGTPSLSIADYSPSTMGGLTPTDALGFMDSMKFNTAGFGEGLNKFGKGITGLTSQLTPQRLIGSVIGNALLPGIGGILGGIIGGTYGDDDTTNNFFGKIGSSLQKDFTDTVNFFNQNTLPETEETISNVMTTSSIMPMRRPPQPTTLDPSFLESDFGTKLTEDDLSELGISDGPVAYENPYQTFNMEESIDQLDYQFNPRRSIFDSTGGQTFGTTPNYGIGDLMREITVTPQSGLDVVTYGDGLPVTYGTSPDDIMQGGYVGYSGTGPISVNFDTMGQGLTPAQIEALRRN